jgi:hypothetical protein
MLRQKLANLLQFDRPNLPALEKIRVGHDTSVTEGGIGVPKKVKLFLPAQQHIPHGKPPRTIQSLVRLIPQTAKHLALRKNLRCALLNEYFLDSTCVKANIHFPTDWVLLRDAVRTLMKATMIIRDAGPRGRMQPPQEFLRRMNRLSMEMTQQTRRAGSKKGRNRVLRQMKRLVGVVRGHARRRRELLAQQWGSTEWTRARAEQVMRRIDGVLELLPRAQKQAHERIIGARQVPNTDKLFSLYEPEVRVIVRGKAGAEVEFGNTVLLGENRQGFILDYEIFRESAPADSQTLFGSLLRVREATGRDVGAVVTDRGLYSVANSRTLREGGTFDALCPRPPAVLREKIKDEQFARLQRRRAQTEGRIGILKRNFLGRPMRAKGFEHRELALAWGELTHSLWMLARLREPGRKAVALQKAA